MYRKLLFASIALLYSIVSFSQDDYSLTLYPDKDAIVRNLVLGGAYYADSTHANYSRVRSFRWTSSGYWHSMRAYIEFDLETIPENAIIQSATLYLYGIDHDPMYRSNESYFARVTGSWEESTITWNTQPGYTSVDSIYIPATTSSTEIDTINVTDFIQGWIDGDYDNNGLMLRLVDETTNQYTRLSYASSDYTIDPAKRPKLEITYKIADKVTLYPDKDATIQSAYAGTNFGTSTNFISMYDTRASYNTIRSLIEFDLSAIPNNSEIVDAYITLYGINHSGTNASYLMRTTESWVENTVTYTNQPSVTSTDQISLANSDSSTQVYKIEITDFIQDWHDGLYDNNGLQLRLQNELAAGRLSFASSDYTTDTTKRPIVEIRYYFDQCIAWGTQWTELINCEVSGDTLRKNAGGTGWNAGAGSRNILKSNEDGWVEYRNIDSFGSAQYKMFGLSNVNLDAGYTNLDCAMYLANGNLYVRHLNGSTYIGTYSSGDYFKVVRSADTIQYYHNNTLVHSVSDPTYGDYQMVVDVTIYTQGAYFKGITSSFCTFPVLGINTKNIDAGYDYKVTGGGLANICTTGDLEAMWINRIVPNNTDTFKISFFSTDTRDSLELTFDMDYDYNISNVEAILDLESTPDTITLDSSFYQVQNGNELILFDGDTSITSSDSLYITVLLEDGLLLSPDGDDEYDELVVTCAEEAESYTITIYDLDDNEIFSTNDIEENWDGKDDSQTLVDKGVYKYEISINGYNVSGQFLVEY